MSKASQGGIAILTTAPHPSSKKVYVQGSRPDLKVPMREVSLASTSGRFGNEDNPPMRLYDTSGPYTDPAIVTDVRRGLPALRRDWILERNDTEEYDGQRVKFGGNGHQPQSGPSNGQPFQGLKRRP